MLPCYFVCFLPGSQNSTIGIFPPNEEKYICICASSRYWGSVCILLSLSNCEYGIELLRPMGCSEQKFKYIYLSVVLVCNPVYNLLLLLYIIRSRNDISVGEISLVKCMVETYCV